MAMVTKQKSWQRRKCHSKDFESGWDHYLKCKAERERKETEQNGKRNG